MSWMEFNIDDFIGSIEAFGEGYLKAVERGAGQAASTLLNDSITEINRAPLEEGTLRGCGSTFVQNKLEETAPNVGGSPTPATVGDETLSPDVITAVVGFNSPYAAYQHEGQRKDGSHVVKEYTHSGTGKKFLEKKLFDNESDYIGVVAAEVKRYVESA